MKFDGILICSDLDNTFRCSENTGAENIEAVKYFTENGGRFTFATGRMSGHLEKSGYFDIINAPACLCNGGVIYDYETKSVISETHVDFSVAEFFESVKQQASKDINFYIFKNSCEGESYNAAFEDMENLSEEIYAVKPIKIVCVFKTVEEADSFRDFAAEHPLFSSCCIAKSWPVGVEINSSGATKGTAIKFIKNHLGNIRTSVGIGDYENDIPLLRDADIGVAVENALDSVKRAADLIVKPASESAIKDLIEKIERKL